MQENRVATLLDQLPGWQVEEAGGHRQLVKEFRTRDFVSAVEFVDRITPIAEAQSHHPDLLVSWGRVRVQLWTHDAGGLSEKDFALAARIDSVAGAS
jgi:4a-hydroxytetrahydrobiopterin dehydratase